jgi:hypothetical protein
VRGGLNSVELLEAGAGVTVDADGMLHGLSVNSAAGESWAELSQGLPNRQIGVSTVGEVRAAGGDVAPAPSRFNPDHCLLNGITAAAAHRLLTPTVPNPSRVR